MHRVVSESGLQFWHLVDSQNVFLAGITDVCEDQVVDGCTNTWMRRADLFLPKVKDMACPW